MPRLPLLHPPFLLLAASLLLLSCGQKKKAPYEGPGANKDLVIRDAGVPDESVLPSVDTTQLTSETAIVDALRKVVEARVADRKKQAENRMYKGYTLQLMKLHTVVMKAYTEYAKTLSDPEKKRELQKQVNELEALLQPGP